MTTTKKPSKVTVKHYLNKNLKPQIDGKEKYYPIYVRIIFNRKIITKKSACWYSPEVSEFENPKQEIKAFFDYEKWLFTTITKKALNDISKDDLNDTAIYNYSKNNNSKDKTTNIVKCYIDFFADSFVSAVMEYCKIKLKTEINNKIHKSLKIEDDDFDKIDIDIKVMDEAKFYNHNLSSNKYRYYILFELLISYIGYCGRSGRYDINLIDWQTPKYRRDFEEYVLKYDDERIIKDFNINAEFVVFSTEVIDKVIQSSDYIRLGKIY